jgi:hypothetical protein
MTTLSELPDDTELMVDFRLALNNGFEVQAKSSFKFSHGDLPAEELASKTPTFVRSGIPNTVLKLKEAIYFLRLMEDNIHSQTATMFHFSAFATAARSVTFVMQKECSKSPGFKEWYQNSQSVLAGITELAGLRDLRNAVQKEGVPPPIMDHSLFARVDRQGKATGCLMFDHVEIAGAGAKLAIVECQKCVAVLVELINTATKLGFFPPATEMKMAQVLRVALENESGDWILLAETAADHSKIDGELARELDRRLVTHPIEVHLEPPKNGEEEE